MYYTNLLEIPATFSHLYPPFYALERKNMVTSTATSEELSLDTNIFSLETSIFFPLTTHFLQGLLSSCSSATCLNLVFCFPIIQMYRILHSLLPFHPSLL